MTTQVQTYFILATYVAQIIQISFFAVPSAGSTVEMLFKVQNNPAQAADHPSSEAVQSRTKTALLIVATLVVTATSLIPLVTIIFPTTIRLLVPFLSAPSDLMQTACIIFLTAGNVLTYIAVAALRRHVSFHPFGETKRLYTFGIYGYSRNPITAGLALIYAGFLLALPTLVMLIGFIFFLMNASYRIRMEEVYLKRAFGDDYIQYSQRVGKYFPRLGKPRHEPR